jgi:hypothetical protein
VAWCTKALRVRGILSGPRVRSAAWLELPIYSTET